MFKVKFYYFYHVNLILKVMKKLMFILCICLGVNTVVWSKSEPDRKEVVLEKVDDDSNKSRPRTLVGVPIICTYSEGTLNFLFYEDLGELEITVTNQSSGVVSVYECDAVTGSAIVDASSASGRYRVEIVAEDGTYYYGDYTL